MHEASTDCIEIAKQFYFIEQILCDFWIQYIKNCPTSSSEYLDSKYANIENGTGTTRNLYKQKKEEGDYISLIDGVCR